MELPSFASDNVPSSQEHNDIWREEIQARVAGYRNRRGRRVEGAFSMRFPFPPMETAPAAEAVSAPDNFVSDSLAEEPQFHNRETAPELSVHPSSGEIPLYAAAMPVQDFALFASPVSVDTAVPMEAAAEPESAPLPPPPRVRPKVIAFPRPIVPEPPSNRLADPVISEAPRILDVPEELQAFPTTPLLDGLQLARDEQQAATPAADHIELPLAPVAVSRRIAAGVIDCVVVTTAFGVLSGAAHKLAPNLIVGKPLLLMAAGAAIVFWAIYQYLFVMYGGGTAGMRMLRIRLSTFKGKTPSWRQRRSRVITLYFSAASLMMGLLWALVDVDTLCWHDRISQTYLTAANRN